MMNSHRPDAADPRGTGATIRIRMGCAVVASLVVSMVVVATALATDSRIGAPLYWTWLLTGLQVIALWSAGARRWWGWLLGASVQPPWIAYALVTGQFGFVPGCVISAVVQSYSFVRSGSGARARARVQQLG